MQVGDLVRRRVGEDHFMRKQLGIIIGWNNRNRGVIPLVFWTDDPENPSLHRKEKLEVLHG